MKLITNVYLAYMQIPLKKVHILTVLSTVKLQTLQVCDVYSRMLKTFARAVHTGQAGTDFFSFYSLLAHVRQLQLEKDISKRYKSFTARFYYMNDLIS